MNTLEVVMDLCEEYISDSNYVYKLCDGKYIVVMKKLPETVTNENRLSVFDPTRAKFRASVLDVVFIVNIYDTNDRPQQVLNKFRQYELMYTVGENIVPHEFNEDIDVVCTGGIHYFKTIDTAYTFSGGQFNNDKFTGHRPSWYDNGQKCQEGMCVNGKRSGIWTTWHENGQKAFEGEYVNGEHTGRWTVWHENGYTESEGEYVDGERSRHWTEWHTNGQKKSEGEYVNGEQSGRWTEWNTNGQKAFEGEYVDGERLGH